MDEQFADIGNGITLCYETFGEAGHPSVLLIMGLGTQMLAWHEDFCRDLAGRGFRVIRFDNRDIGRSTHLDDVPPPTAAQLLRRSKRAAAYRLSDMADDAAGLLDALGIDAAHVVGASMGGMIAQSMAARHPDRVRSLVSIMSNTGARFSGQPALRVYPTFVQRPARHRDEAVERSVRLFRIVGSTGFERDEDELRELARTAYERAYNPAGAGRQLAAILASGDRTRELRGIRVPTLVIHGDADRLIAPSGGRATARAIPGARLMRIPGMGHDLPRGAWPRILDAIATQAHAADGTAGTAVRAA